MKFLFDFLGRLFLSFIFVVSCANKVLDWNATQGHVTNGLLNWQSFASQYIWAESFLGHLLSLVTPLTLVAIIFEGLGGLLVLVGVKVKLGAFLLILFLIPSTLMFHSFWMFQGGEWDTQLVMFLKNMSILGGLFLLMASESSAKGSSA